jgi:hypothetical protein
MSREHLVRTVANTIATVGLRFNMTGKQPSDLYHAMAEHLADAQLLQSPETAAEAEAEPLALPWAHVMPDDDLHGFLGDLLSAAIGRWQHSPEVPDREVLAAIERACAAWRTPGRGYRSDEPAEPERPADEDPIRYTLTEQAEGEVFVPRTERQRWVDIADALNAAHAADMPVSIDLDGTLTDHRMWSVVWDRQAERWSVAGYDVDAEDPCHPCGCPKRFDRHADGCPTLAEAEDPARCLKAHPFSPRDGWRMVCGNCDHGKDAPCHQDGDA